MYSNKKQVVSNIVALGGAFVTPQTAQAALNSSNLNVLVKTTRKSAAAQQAADVLNKVKATKKVLDFVKRDAQKAINKAKNIRNDALRKLNQAEEIAEGAKEDWNIKVIIAAKKSQELESKPEKRYLIKQVEQAKQDVEEARENFENKKSEVAKKRLYLQKCQGNLQTVIQMQNSRIQTAEMACKTAQIEQQKAIYYSV